MASKKTWIYKSSGLRIEDVRESKLEKKKIYQANGTKEDRKRR
jgi:hypothetical protein